VRIDKIKQYRAITKSKRIEILKHYCEQIQNIFPKNRIINICLDKTQYKSKNAIQEVAWDRLIQRFDNYLKKAGKDFGTIISDSLNNKKLIRNKLRKMRIRNNVPSFFGSYYNNPVKYILEDISERDSKQSYFIQTVDVIAFVLYKREYPKGSGKKYNLDKLFYALEPVLLKKASSDKYGVVRK